MLPAANGQPSQAMQFNSEGGNVDERVPYIGYAGESELYTAAGISAYNALQAHVEKRLSHGLAAGVSYTGSLLYSRPFDTCVVYSPELGTCGDIRLHYNTAFGKPVASSH